MSTDYLALTREIRTRAANGDLAGARERLRIALLRGDLDSANLERAARLLASVADPESSAHEVLVLGQCTTSWVTQSLPPLLLSHGVEATAVEGQYDNIMQELTAREAAGQRPRIVVLVPWNTRLLANTGLSLNERVAEQLSFWKQCWNRCHDMGSSVVQLGYDWTRTGPLGLHLSVREGDLAIIREMNRVMQDSMPTGGYYLDLETVAGEMGRRKFYDARQYHWTKQPFSSDGCVELSQTIASSIRAILNGPRKVLVLDLDNTVWGGVVGETGPLGVELGESPTGEAYRAFQSYVKQLSSRGVLLAVASKNNPEDAREPFTSNPAMQLSLDDIVAFEASWDPKESALRRIAKALNLGTDSLVFFDDNPAEREHIRQALPEVAVPEVPEDPAEYIDALERGRWFEAISLTEEDRARSSQYQQERKRRDLESAAGSMEEYLDSLEMIADVREIGEEDMPRVVQLLGKTNQFNLTTRRHSESQVREILAMPRSLGLTIRLADRFGDHGLVAVMLGRPSDSDPMALLIDTWLMSCRVIGRTTEQFTLRQILDRARRLGYHSVIGEYIPTRKNMLVQDLLPRLGFAALPKDDSESQRFSIATDADSPASQIKALTPDLQC